jgi:hypothetical protein
MSKIGNKIIEIEAELDVSGFLIRFKDSADAYAYAKEKQELKKELDRLYEARDLAELIADHILEQGE